MMNKLDTLVDRGADRLQEFAEQAAARGGLGERVAEELAEDAAFLRKLKPSLIAARARGEPTDQAPEQTQVTVPSGPQLGKRPGGGAGPNPIVVVAAALALGILLAKAIDWRGHAHPRE
ncbi:MAG TPA: hypothetical protein VG079_06570 [Gaiellaceae bacterium]|nr:hypothetical protein [Gaiellaceae bacterium]